jgi:hypothetical protein
VTAALVNLKKHEVKRMIQMKLTQVVLLCLSKGRLTWLSSHKLQRRFDVIAEVCRLFDDVELVPEAIQIFGRVNRHDLEPLHMDYLHYFISPAPCKLAKASNPLMTCVILADFLDSIKACLPSYSLKLEKLSLTLVKVAETIKDETSRLWTHAVYSAKPFGTWTLMVNFINNPGKYLSFLNTPLAKQLSLKHWTEDKSVLLSFDSCSYIVEAIECLDPVEKLWKLHTKRLKTAVNSVFQFESWLHNSGVRHAAETAAWVFFLAVMIYILTVYIDSSQQLRQPLDLTYDDMNQIQDDYDAITDSAERYLLTFVMLNGLQSFLWLKKRISDR